MPCGWTAATDRHAPAGELRARGQSFTFGVANVVEDDVKAAARVFTGWNRPARPSGAFYYRYEFRANRHDNRSRTYLPIYPERQRRHRQRRQEGIDLITALCNHPATGPRLVRKLWVYFVSEIADPPQPWVDRTPASTTRPVSTCAPSCAIPSSPEFWDPAAVFARYSWPVEFVVRAIETGWTGYWWTRR